MTDPASFPFHTRTHAAAAPDRTAVVVEPSGESVTYRELEQRSARLAHRLRTWGLTAGDHIAIMSPNAVDVLVVSWAAQRSGLRYTPLNPQLSADEAAYIIDDCGARVLFAGPRVESVAETVVDRTPTVAHRVAIGGAGIPDHTPLATLLATPVSDTGTGDTAEVEGMLMGYTSGTTGRPKGVLRPLSGNPTGAADPLGYLADRVALGVDDRFLITSGLYHAAPCAWAISSLRRGATVVVMERFDAATALGLIAAHRITHGLFVPTMFVRMLKLADDIRESADVSTLRSALHVGAPCPPDVKQAMIAWWGPVIDEFYSSTEANGTTFIGSEEALERPGSVGRAIRGVVHITGDDGEELPVGATGWVYFDSPSEFAYHGDPDKTAAAHDHRGWSKLGDIGRLDDDGYLYLSDRADFTVITGGVNIYPAEIENALALHPDITDVAAFGIPDEELGERLIVVVEPAPHATPGSDLADAILAFCADHLARYKVPREVRFVDELPRQESGKLAKAALRARYL